MKDIQGFLTRLPCYVNQLPVLLLHCTGQNTRKMRTSRARLPKKLTFEPGDYV